jgi:hypothetical protein
MEQRENQTAYEVRAGKRYLARYVPGTQGDQFILGSMKSAFACLDQACHEGHISYERKRHEKQIIKSLELNSKLTWLVAKNDIKVQGTLELQSYITAGHTAPSPDWHIEAKEKFRLTQEERESA